MNEDQLPVLQESVAQWVARDARVTGAVERDGPQGYSGSRLRYINVSYARAGAAGTLALVVKQNAPLHERLAAVRLCEQRLPGAPLAFAPDLRSDAPGVLCLQDVSPDGTEGDGPQALAQAHAANMGREAEMPWLPRADRAFFHDWLAEGCCLELWRPMFTDEAFRHSFGLDWPAPAPGTGACFAERFGPYDAPLRDAAARFVDHMVALTRDDAALTLVHADLHDQHLLARGGQAYLIDWGQARYGPPDIDLPNIFCRDDALRYRDALASLGHDIPRDAFLARFDAARPYVGLKYFGIGLWNWRYNGQDDANVWHFLKLIIGEPERAG